MKNVSPVLYFAMKIWCCRLDWAIMLTRIQNVWFPSFVAVFTTVLKGFGVFILYKESK